VHVLSLDPQTLLKADAEREAVFKRSLAKLIPPKGAS
jgi:hypothetical protein